MSPEEVPAVLVANHAPFTWGARRRAAIENARVLEFVARIEWQDAAGRARRAAVPIAFLVDKHFLRKHGAGAYYGQK